MGGGALFRGVARWVGSATTAAISSSPAQQALCRSSSSSSNIRRQESFACALKETNAKEEEEIVHQYVLFPPPSTEEVEEATDDLRVALHLSLPASQLIQDASSISDVTDREEEAEDKQVMDVSRSSGDDFTERKRSVMQALHLMQTNPKVQDVVKSLASDPAVWNAMLNNEKLLQFASSQPSTDEHQKDKKDQPKDRNENSLTKFSSKVYDIYSGVSEKVLGLFHKVIFLFNSIYESTNQNLLPKGNGNVVDKTVVSCMMLAVAVLLMVFVKRGSK